MNRKTAHNEGTDTPDLMVVWQHAKTLMKACERVLDVSEAAAEQNQRGFEYGDKFILY